MKKIRLICLLLGILMLLSSCQSVYDVPLVPPETTANPNVDLSDEYYTTGVPYRTGDISSGMLYEGCLIYIEKCTTTGIVGDETDADGVKTPIYGDVTVERIVKYNPVTGTVSSPCLNPNCNHSLESGCPMLLGGKVNDGKSQVYVFQGIFGDWLVYLRFVTDDEYGSVMSEIMYNLKTGEVRENFSDDYGEKVVSKWRNGWYVDGKYYKVNSVMDYSKTGYTPGSGQKLSDFKPVTRQYVYEYDFDTDESKMLFELDDVCRSFMATNERFYIEQSDGNCVSIKKDGTDKREEPKIAASNFVGTYSILYNTNGFSVYDLKTDETKEVIWEYSVLGNLCVTEKGVLSAHQTKYDEWDNFSAGDYRKEHPNASSTDINNAARKILASGTAQIWQCGYMGEDNHVIFELPAGRIEVISAYGEYVFAKVSKYDTDTGEYLEGYKNKTCSINVKTGEITPIPQLDIVVPYWYVNQ